MNKKNKLWLFITITIIAAGLSLSGCASLKLEELERDTVEGPRQVGQGQDINPRDITVYGYYGDGSRKRVNISSSNITFNKDATGNQTVRVRVSGHEVSFQTQVMALTAIRVSAPPSKISYVQGEALNLSGLRVTGTWQSLPEADIGVTMNDVSGYNPNTLGSQRITITKYGRTATFNVTVTEYIHPLVGTWIMDMGTNNMGDVWEVSLTFNKDGSGSTGLLVNGSAGGPPGTFKWSASGNILTTDNLDGTVGTGSYSISGNTLTVVSEGESQTLTRR